VKGREHMTTQLEALQQALEQQRKYERENWPFVDGENKPTGTGESITYHLASLYCWSPEYVLTLEPEARLERLNEIWRTFSIAGDLIHRYEDATLALLQEQETLSLLEQKIDTLSEDIAMLRETTDTAIKHLAGHVSHLALQLRVNQQESE